jgi:hypothetical protein
MKLYATTTSERATKGQGGNDYLEINLFINDRNQPQFRLRVMNDKLIGQTYISLQSYHFKQWHDVYSNTLFENIEPKGNKQKGE